MDHPYQYSFSDTQEPQSYQLAAGTLRSRWMHGPYSGSSSPSCGQFAQIAASPYIVAGLPNALHQKYSRQAEQQSATATMSLTNGSEDDTPAYTEIYEHPSPNTIDTSDSDPLYPSFSDEVSEHSRSHHPEPLHMIDLPHKSPCIQNRASMLSEESDHGSLSNFNSSVAVPQQMANRAETNTDKTQVDASGSTRSECNLENAPYAKIIFTALLSAPDHRMVLTDIYQWIEENTNKADNPDYKGWQNSVRHNLSMNEVSESYILKNLTNTLQAFTKIPCAAISHKGRKGYMWRLEESAIKHGMLPTTRYRRKDTTKTVSQRSMQHFHRAQKFRSRPHVEALARKYTRGTKRDLTDSLRRMSEVFERNDQPPCHFGEAPLAFPRRLVHPPILGYYETPSLLGWGGYYEPHHYGMSFTREAEHIEANNPMAVPHLY